MTRWLIALNASNPEEDSKVLKLMMQAAKLGLAYTVTSKEVKEDAKTPKDQ